MLASVAVGAVWKFLYAPFFGIVATVGSALGFDTPTVAPLADTDTALWAVMVAFLWRFAGFSMVVYVAAIQALPREYYEHAVLEGASWFQRLRHITWPLLWPQTFTLVLLTTLGTLRIFDMVWVMTAGGPSHATETVATHVYTTAFRFLEVGYAQAMAMILLVVILLLTVVEYRLLNRARRDGELVTRFARPAMVDGAAHRSRRRLAVSGGLDADERGQVERRHLPRPVGPALAAGCREHRRGLGPRAARGRAGELGVCHGA